jgi:hypothetical protein
MGAIGDAVSQATKAVRFDRIVIVGLLAVLALIVVLSFVLPLTVPSDSKAAEFVLSFFKDVALILVGALSNSVRQKHTEDSQGG